MNTTQLIALGLPTGSEWLIILVVVLLFFGGAKIPQLMRGIGKGVGEFQAGLTQGKRALKTAMDEAAAEEESKADGNKAV
jgi:sec-independent protein translocase protein TatA